MSTWTQIARLDAPASGVFDFTGLSIGSYVALQVVIAGVTVTTDGTDVSLRFYVGGVEQTSGYTWATQHLGHVPTAAGENDGAAAVGSILLCSDNATRDTGNAAGEHFNAIVEVDDPNNTATHKRVAFLSCSINPGGGESHQPGTGVLANTGAIDGVKVMGTSDLTAGSVVLLGLA